MEGKKEGKTKKNKFVVFIKMTIVMVLLFSIFNDMKYMKTLFPSTMNQVSNQEPETTFYNRIPTYKERERYQLQRDRNDTGVNNIRSIEYRGVSGLGHRLTKMSGAYHLAKVTNSTRLWVSWGWECGTNEDGNPDIFDNLFGVGPMIVGPLVSVRNEGADDVNYYGWESSMFWLRNETKQLPSAILQHHYNNGNAPRFINEVAGYSSITALLAFSSLKEMKMKMQQDLFLEKLISDVEFFHQLRVLFRFNHMAREFTEYHRFTDHLVIGLHVRAGNGELGDFTDKERGFDDIDAWMKLATKTLSGLNSTLSNMNEASDEMNQQKPPLVFLATDTPSVITKLSDYMKPYGISVVSFFQERMKNGTGSTWNQKWNTSSLCHQSWVDQFMDATILSTSDVMVAGTYSSFSQSVPWTTMLAGSILGTIGRTFCEMKKSGRGLTCYNDYRKWIFADEKIERENWHRKELVLPNIYL